jgi:hypothetical protein
MEQLKLAKKAKKEGPITTKNFGKTESAPKQVWTEARTIFKQRQQQHRVPPLVRHN